MTTLRSLIILTRTLVILTIGMMGAALLVLLSQVD
jgi:hypothetical protein